jgi:cell division septum initiation protein DivIVA
MSLPRMPRSSSRPKLRTIPRRKTEAAVYSEIQQLSVEKQRLHQELAAMHERKGQIEERLGILEQSIAALKQQADRYAEAAQTALDPTVQPVPPQQVYRVSPQRYGADAITTIEPFDY